VMPRILPRRMTRRQGQRQGAAPCGAAPRPFATSSARDYRVLGSMLLVTAMWAIEMTLAAWS
ncbi:MAG TPA: hypothetical protein DIU14_04025, partial [Actinobacteria bacterium]|nr:hypothetical protein [Actinomycetota bacterium]